jgi:predicted transcriptional regulator
MKPQEWHLVYPQGTKAGDEEQKFFIAIARHPKWAWRSVSAIAKETNLTKQRVEEIVSKYYKKGMVFQNPTNEDQWGYFSRVPEMLPKDNLTITEKDQKERVAKVMKP